ncbi:hypothetical protein [Thermococcus zilligii]|uniref:hypothetical protein n=1 Tax=Thermococcus zilligii TaxID=54076 RepID=UPI0005942C8A|nr:hypothetical protein [Thermococcus zilligii]
MSINLVRKELFRKVNHLAREIEDGMNYGVPHLVGEIEAGDPPKVELSVAVFDGSYHRFILKDEGKLYFMLPVDSSNPGRVFMEVWTFLNGKTGGSVLTPGTKIRGILSSELSRRGFETIWMNVYEKGGTGYVEVLAVKENARYRMTFEKAGDELILLEIEKI